MRISDNEIKKVLCAPEDIVGQIVELGEDRGRAEDQRLVEETSAKVMAMPDREDVIAELKARIQAGAYNPSADAIVDGMVRRAIADRVR